MWVRAGWALIHENSIIRLKFLVEKPNTQPTATFRSWVLASAARFEARTALTLWIKYENRMNSSKSVVFLMARTWRLHSYTHTRRLTAGYEMLQSKYEASARAWKFYVEKHIFIDPRGSLVRVEEEEGGGWCGQTTHRERRGRKAPWANTLHHFKYYCEVIIVEANTERTKKKQREARSIFRRFLAWSGILCVMNYWLGSPLSPSAVCLRFFSVFFFKLEGDANERARARKVKVVKMPASRAKQTEHN